MACIAAAKRELGKQIFDLTLVEFFEDFSKRLPDAIDDVYEWQLNSCVRGNLRSKFQNWSALTLCLHRG